MMTADDIFRDNFVAENFMNFLSNFIEFGSGGFVNNMSSME